MLKEYFGECSCCHSKCNVIEAHCSGSMPFKIALCEKCVDLLHEETVKAAKEEFQKRWQEFTAQQALNAHNAH